MKYIRVTRHLISGFVLALSVCLFACEEIDVPVIIDEDEIARYIEESDVGIELFRKENLFPNDYYGIPGDPGAVYVDLVDSVKRSTEVYILLNHYGAEGRDYIQDFGNPIGITRDAEATVTDNFYIRTIRIEGNDSTTFNFLRPVVRYAYFLKLGDDNQAFRGWLMMGFSGGGPFPLTRVEGVRADNSTFPADSVTYLQITSIIIDATTSQWDTLTQVSTETGYLWLNGTPQVARISDGENLQFNVRDPSDSSLFFTLSGESDANFSVVTMTSGESLPFASLDTPEGNTRPWNIVYLREFRSPHDAPVSWVPINQMLCKGWCVPYRVEN